MKIMKSILVVLTGLALPLHANAQDYPGKTITVVVPFTPGAGNDLIGRFLADGLEKLWKQTVVVENRPGAGSAIGSAHVAKSAPDGHTILFVSGTITTNAATKQDLPFDPINDLTPVSPAAIGRYLLVAGPRVKATNVAEFIEEAKSREMFYASAGVGSLPQFAMELFSERAGLKMTPVQYKGGSEIVIDLVGGRVDAFIGGLTTSLPSVEGGQLKALAVASPERAPELPDVPTTAESGVQGAEVNNWFGVFVPSGTPAAVIGKLNAAVKEVMSTPEAAAFLAKYGVTPASMTADEFRQLVHGEFETWKKLAAERNISSE